jgi:hypothetical protein
VLAKYQPKISRGGVERVLSSCCCCPKVARHVLENSKGRSKEAQSSRKQKLARRHFKGKRIQCANKIEGELRQSEKDAPNGRDEVGDSTRARHDKSTKTRDMQLIT